MKRILAILLAMLMVLALVACAAEPAPTTPADTTKPADTTVTEPADEPAEAPADEPADEPAEAPADEPAEAPADEPVEEPVTVESALPIVDEIMTYTVWCTYGLTGLPITNFSENHAWNELEARTNIDIEWTHSNNAAEQFNLSLVSGDWYDSYWQAPWNGSLDYYIEEEMVLDLTDLIAQYAPNYDSLRRVTNDSYKSTLTDGGRSAGFFDSIQSLQTPYVGPLIRNDWLKKVGKDLPQTYDELYEVLVAFRDEIGADIPLAITPAGIDDWLSAGMGTVYASWFNEEFYQVNGEMKFGPITPEFKAYVEMIAKWYAEDLLDPEFYSRGLFDSISGETGEMCQEYIGAGRAMYFNIDMAKGMSSNPDFELVALPAITNTPGEQVPFVLGGGSVTYMSLNPSVIMTTCENPENLVKWFDYLYSDEGSLLLNYGIEGQSFEFNEDGEPRLTAMIYDDADLSLNQMLSIWTGSGSGGPWNYDWTRETTTPKNSPAQLAARDVWLNSTSAEHNTVASLTISEENSDEYNSIMADVRTCVAENLPRFIIGEKNMTNEWDAFQATLQSMGIETAVAMQQEAYDSFQHRGE